MNVSDKTHPHHAVWRENLEGALSQSPKLVQVNAEEDQTQWIFLHNNDEGICDEATWSTGYRYRIARPMVTRTITYPAPMSQVPKIGTIYWAINIFSNEAHVFSWCGDRHDFLLLKRGMAFATEEDAKAAAQAIFGVQE